jgi:hypothetical protein
LEKSIFRAPVVIFAGDKDDAVVELNLGCKILMIAFHDKSE